MPIPWQVPVWQVHVQIHDLLVIAASFAHFKITFQKEMQR